jgi:SAM-dependent methyltransferase
MAGRTESGDYRLPTAPECAVGNVVLKLATAAPRLLSRQLLTRHHFYQAFDGNLAQGQQGISESKWIVMQRASNDLRNKTVLDIGCAEGFFCRQAAMNGASRVIGVDSRLGTLLCAQFIALKEQLPIRYRLGVFPQIGFRDCYDVVFCLSVLHHTVSTKDVWKVLSQDSFKSDLNKLRGQLTSLRRMIRPKGRCIIEMPYEYDDPAERAEVDFERFTSELISAGFSCARQLGPWEHRKEHQAKKDRILYVAESS